MRRSCRSSGARLHLLGSLRRCGHGAPGAEATEISKGLYPEAPDLAQAAESWTPAELYVVIKRGIKMSGKAAWELTHSGEEIWALAAFLKVLPTMRGEADFSRVAASCRARVIDALNTDRRHVFVTSDGGSTGRQIAKNGDLP